MTREEAIYRLKNAAWLGTNAGREETEQAVDMAIEALQTIDNCDQCEWCCPSDGIPTIHVVRCKDCKWAEKAILDDYCVECTMYHTSCMKLGYCHHGERREE